MYKKIINCVFLLLIVITIGACNYMNEAENEVVDNGCIPPLETFSYRLRTDKNKPIPDYSFKILPTSPWEDVITLPKPTSTETITSLELVRTINGSSEIYVLRSPHIGYHLEENPEYYQVLVYNENQQTWKTTSSIVDDSEVFVVELFSTSDGTIWGKNNWDETSSSIYPVLSQYNETSNQFIFVEELTDFAEITREQNPWTESFIILDSDDVFWIFVQNEAIYSFNTKTKEIKMQVEIKEIFVENAVKDTDGNIYFLDFSISETVNDVDFYQFNLTSGSVEKILIKLEPWPTPINLLADHENRIWFNNIGWLDPDGEWYQLMRSPIFLTNIQWSGLDYRWRPPKILLESLDGRLWFQSDNGLAWLDFDEEEWCWFTTFSSNIIQDNNGSLWIIADDKLFVHP